MQCDHCQAMRRGEGGLNLGGVVSAVIVPGCPCSALPRIPDDSLYNDFGIAIPTAAGNYSGYTTVERRFCALEDGLVIPELVDIECTNYDLSDLETELIINVFGGATDGSCGAGGLTLICFSYWVDGNPISEGNFNSSTIPGTWYYVQVFLNVNNTISPFVDPPIFNLKYEFVR